MATVAGILASLVPDRVNKHGNALSSGFAVDCERYVVDFAPDRQGWKQFDTDQDAWYFGVWVNPERLLMLTYAEGDWSLSTAKNKDTYNAEIASMCEFYDEGRIALVIDMDGGATEFRQDRAEFFIK